MFTILSSVFSNVPDILLELDKYLWNERMNRWSVFKKFILSNSLDAKLYLIGLTHFLLNLALHCILREKSYTVWIILKVAIHGSKDMAMG